MGGVNNKQQMSRIININGTQHLITSPKPIPELRKINNVQVKDKSTRCEECDIVTMGSVSPISKLVNDIPMLLKLLR